MAFVVFVLDPSNILALPVPVMHFSCPDVISAAKAQKRWLASGYMVMVRMDGGRTHK